MPSVEQHMGQRWVPDKAGLLDVRFTFATYFDLNADDVLELSFAPRGRARLEFAAAGQNEDLDLGSVPVVAASNPSFSASLVLQIDLDTGGFDLPVVPRGIGWPGVYRYRRGLAGREGQSGYWGLGRGRRPGGRKIYVISERSRAKT